MKKIILIAVLTLASISAFAQNGRSIYNKYSDKHDVSAVYISPAMFKLLGRIPDVNAGDESINLTSVIKSFEGFYVIDSSNASINDDLAKDVKKFVKAGDYELLMEAKDSGDIVHIYTVGKDVLNSIVMLSVSDNETTFICVDGKMARSELEKIIASQM